MLAGSGCRALRLEWSQKLLMLYALMKTRKGDDGESITAWRWRVTPLHLSSHLMLRANGAWSVRLRFSCWDKAADNSVFEYQEVTLNLQHVGPLFLMWGRKRRKKEMWLKRKVWNFIEYFSIEQKQRENVKICFLCCFHAQIQTLYCYVKGVKLKDGTLFIS